MPGFAGAQIQSALLQQRFRRRIAWRDSSVGCTGGWLAETPEIMQAVLLAQRGGVRQHGNLAALSATSSFGFVALATLSSHEISGRISPVATGASGVESYPGSCVLLRARRDQDVAGRSNFTTGIKPGLPAESGESSRSVPADALLHLWPAEMVEQLFRGHGNPCLNRRSSSGSRRLIWLRAKVSPATI